MLLRVALLLATSCPVTADTWGQQEMRPPPCTSTSLKHWRNQLAQVRLLRSRDEHEANKIIRTRIRQTELADEPSFMRLFTHEMWARYSQRSPMQRWWHHLVTWRYSTVLHAVWPCMLLIAMWGFVVSFADQRVPRFLGWLRSDQQGSITPIPVELQGTAIGLLLVFRTNNGYDRLAEARAVLGRALCLSREIAQTIACTWPAYPLYEEREGTVGGGAVGGEVALAAGHPGASGGFPCEESLQVVRYLVAFAWSLKATLREPVHPDACDVLRTLLHRDEVHALLKAPSVPVALLGRMRMLFSDEQRRGRLQSHIHQKLEEDLRDLNLLLADNQRLFHSPIPPTMSRHVGRCLLIWLTALPVVLAKRMHPVGVAVACGVSAFIFLGMEEIGAQVEQPFELMPLWQLCHLMAHDAEAAIAGNAPGHIEGIF